MAGPQKLEHSRRTDSSHSEFKKCSPLEQSAHYHHHHLSLNREGRWGTTDNFAASFLHPSLFSTALCDLANSRPVHSLLFSSSVCLVFFPLSLCLARWFWPDLMNGRHDHTTAVCVSLDQAFVWSDCLLDLATDFLVGNMVFVRDA